MFCYVVRSGWLSAVGALSLLLLASGCGSGRVLEPVAGEVQLSGQPLSSVLVTFVPVSTTTGTMRPATGTADAAGKFSLGTYDPGDGATPGEYKVTVEWMPPANVQLSGDGGFEAMRKSRQGGPPAQVSPVHENYARVDKTPLKVTVPIAGPLVLNLKPDGT